MLDFNADWVHVRISGLSRGWIWRTGLEMPEGISNVPPNSPSAAPVAADLFQVAHDETAPFPGDWEPLRGRNVRIISVQKIQENEKNSGVQAKLEFAKSLLDKNYAELAKIAGTVWRGLDLRFGRWGHDRCNAGDGSGMEGGHLVRRGSVASVLF